MKYRLAYFRLAFHSRSLRNLYFQELLAFFGKRKHRNDRCGLTIPIIYSQLICIGDHGGV